MATGRKGNGTTARRRAKSVAKQATVAMHESNGISARNGSVEAGSNTGMNVELVRARAYELFLARGATHGNDLADWLNAEGELRVARTP